MTKTINNTAPDINGFGRAWRWEASRAAKDDKAGLAQWIVNAAWAHPIWPNYCVTVIHLRDLPGQEKPANINLPGATHEVMVIALNPEHVPSLEPDAGLKYLTPLNFRGQFVAESDEAAVARVQKDVEDICAGLLNPDTDGTQQWVARYGDHCFKKEFRDAKPGTMEHTLMQGGAVVIIENQPGKRNK